MIILRNKSAITQHYDDYLTGQLELGLTVVDTKSVSKFQFPSQIDSFRHERHERYSRPTVQRSRWGQSALTMHNLYKRGRHYWEVKIFIYSTWE